MTRFLQTILLLVALLSFSCSGEPGQTISADGGADSADTLSEADLPRLDVPRADGFLLDLPESDESATDIVPDLESGCQGSGCFGAPCDDHTDCLYGPCVQHMGNKVCSMSCVEECPDGWACEQVAGAGPDLTFACVSPFTHLCRPCVENGDCESVTGVKDVCVDYGEPGRFCGASCLGGSCPAGYECKESTTTDGAVLLQCVNLSGQCACSQEAVKLGLATVCSTTNEFGTCGGQRACSEAGLAPCNAQTPAAEICNGLDDDCDGEVDGALCDDGNDCTMDTCDPELGCLHEALSGTDCNDANVCSLADHCEAGVCVGTQIDCDDDNPCTTDNCEPTGGCSYTFNSSSCDDDDPCSVNDTCKQGQCQGFPIDCDCTKDSDCIALEDGNICNGTLVCNTAQPPFKCQLDLATVVTCPVPTGPDAPCLKTACHPLSGECSQVPANDGQLCDDTDPCTVADACQEGVCSPGTPLNCNDGNPCTHDLCEVGVGCQNEPNSDPCNDGNPCTTKDFCSDGECLSQTALDCDDNNPCTDDTCDIAGGCIHTANAAPCDDGSLCTQVDLCIAGQCIGGQWLDCNDDNLCTDDMCDGDVGCLHTFNSAPCNDGNSCSTVDLCQEGLCTGTAPLVCDDANPCTDDTCSPGEGCQFSPNAAACDDANACTKDDQCNAGKCLPGLAIDCDDSNLCTTDTCSPATGCIHTPNAAPCDDGNACTTNDVCGAGSCAGLVPVSCNDQNPCTDDSCDEVLGCQFQANQANCDDANPCTTIDLCVNGTCTGKGLLDCDDDNVCTDDVCDPESGCIHQLNTAPCDDGDVCTTKDACQLGECVGSGALNCNDGNICTDDSCDPDVGCLQVANSQPCDDSNKCTEDDTCSKGWCLGNVISCSDDNVCTDDTCDAESGCLFATNTAPCDDGNKCTLVDLCADGQCVGSQEPDCDDDNTCTDDACLPETGCAHTNNFADCDDDNACTSSDLCVDGECKPGAAVVCDDSDVCTTDSCDAADGCVSVAIAGCCKIDADCDDSNVNTYDTCVNNACLNVLDEGLPHNSVNLGYTHTGGSGGCGDFSNWYMKSFGTMTWRECEKKANRHGAQFVGTPDLYSDNSPYKGQQRWVGEKNADTAYVTVGGWSSVNAVAKSATYLCVLGYANGTGPGADTLPTTKSWDGRTYHVKDFGNISEKTCYSYCRQYGARPLNPVLFGSSGTAHMVENHSCHGSIQYSGNSTAADGGGSHVYKCFIGYYDTQ